MTHPHTAIPALTTLSVIVPCYNEEHTVATVLESILAADVCGLRLEVIVVDDGSSDGSADQIAAMAAAHPDITLLRHPRNRGKGAALRTGIERAIGDVILIQDADLEYSVEEYPRLLRAILEGRADVVFGSRFRGGEEVRVLYFWHSVANRLLTVASNMFTDLNLTDMETCYKVFRREVIKAIEIEEDRFGFEPEITAKIAHLASRPRIYEVGIKYDGRTYAEGKKIGWRDGLWALWCILRYNLLRPTAR